MTVWFQIVPTRLRELLGDPDPQDLAAGHARDALDAKIDIATLERAAAAAAQA